MKIRSHLQKRDILLIEAKPEKRAGGGDGVDGRVA